ncbi:MAG TPA: bifunctional 2-polyprenyl-6-hydroxyphenol methylase/3-demethylubiquinol 3-O-methyltransferase UbiG [Steroidobacteraceae bacterium]|jgi:2-polyprenyl-6-hydroxyphenyl methylase/3-demethylubiquinone-9 3-methyltransferase|nr:bifunctional 2-polyprenyl-6-hydroxyphenol methylase/3-demethylubiquinol 3-O-methyltransferase UbiG [Steroidobacteraceae bacterium]
MQNGPNADPAELAKFGAAAPRWWDPDGEFRPLHDLNPARLDYIEARAGLAGKNVLDVGCGGGLLAEGMARRGARVTGIDLAPEALAVARLHAIETGTAVEYRQVAVESLADEAPASFDLVTCLEMLEHVPDPAAVVAALARLARPGGHVVCSTINRNAKAFALAIVGAEYVMRLLPAGTHRYSRLIRPAELSRWGRAAGLELVGLAGLSYDPFARRARITEDVSVNYLAHFRRPAATAAP